MSGYGGYKMIEHSNVLQLVLDTPMQLVLFHGQSKSCDSFLTIFGHETIEEVCCQGKS